MPSPSPSPSLISAVRSRSNSDSPGSAALRLHAGTRTAAGHLLCSDLGGAVELPRLDHGPPSLAFFKKLRLSLFLACNSPHGTALAARDLRELVARAKAVMSEEPNVVRVDDPVTTFVVGDVHGQFHDLCHIMDLTQAASTPCNMVFAGDYVDRGCWGVECLILLMVLKLMFPRNVFLLRGNHETSYCTEQYGFAREVQSKYGSGMLEEFLGMFCELPVAAVINGGILVVHGGLWRSNPTPPTSRMAPTRVEEYDYEDERLRQACEEPGQEVRGPGTLEQLEAANRRETDPTDPIILDALWSDPTDVGDVSVNPTRGSGLLYGPLATEAFLAANKLRLVIRAHEGPDARAGKNTRLNSMERGFSVDHCVSGGMLVTVFSAPDYPQFKPWAAERDPTKGAFLTLRPPHFNSLEFTTFHVSPRPAGHFYR